MSALSEIVSVFIDLNVGALRFQFLHEFEAALMDGRRVIILCSMNQENRSRTVLLVEGHSTDSVSAWVPDKLYMIKYNN